MGGRRLVAAVVGTCVLAFGVSAFAAEGDGAAAPAANFSNAQLDEMVSPVALYPDPLLMQVLMASTYPLEVVEADRWRRQQKSLKDDALDKALEGKDWDPSIEGLTHFPDLLHRMSENLDWTKDLGDAFLGQKDALLDAVQRMRRLAMDAGSLKTTKEQTVIKEKETIVIQPAEPQVVYVPTYAPSAVYGSYAPPAPYYPAVYGYTPGQMATASLLSFGVGIGVGALISDGCNWGHHDVYVNNNYNNYGGGGGGGGNNNVNVNKNVDRSKNVNRQKWEHNSSHRRNVDYRNSNVSQKYQGRDTAARERQRRDASRGFDQASARPGAGGRPDQRPAGGNRGDGRPGGQRPATADRKPGGGGGGGGRGGGRQGAFDGYGNGHTTRQASQRGAQSRGKESFAGRGGGGGGGGGGGQRAGGHRGGGGGGGGHRGGGGGHRGGGGGGGGGRRR